MLEHKLIKVEEGNPLRCQASVKFGQCPFKRDEDSEFCPMHTQVAQKKSKEEVVKRLYRLAKWQNRLDEFADHDKIKSLREETGILRIMLEEIMNKCHDADQILIYSSKISDMIMKIEKVVSSCHRLELSTGGLLDKSAIIQLAGIMVDIVGRHINDQEILNSISDEFLLSIAESRIVKGDNAAHST